MDRPTFTFKKKQYGFVTEQVIDGKRFQFFRGEDPKDEIKVKLGSKSPEKVAIKSIVKDEIKYYRNMARSKDVIKVKDKVILSEVTTAKVKS